MKICFLLQRRFAYVGHAMALTFKKKYGINEFCGYVELRKSLEFLKSQNDIAYTKLLLDEDIHKQYKNEQLDLNYLAYLEREYGIPNLWPYIESDRIVRYNMLLREYPYDKPEYSHEEMMRIVQVTARNVIKFFEEEKPDFIFFSVILGIDGMLLYHIAKKMGIRTFFLQSPPLTAKCSLAENYNKDEYMERAFDEIRKNSPVYQSYIDQAEKFLKEFRNKPFSYSAVDTPEARPITRRKQFSFLLPNKLLKSAVWLVRIFYGYFKDKNRDDYSNIKPWHWLLDRIKRKTRILIGFDDLYDEIKPGEDFAFFPLHLEPEMSLTLAPFYADQFWVIKQIARSLPLHYKLYVKEHPAMFGYRPRKYYKELKKIPNLKLVKPTIKGLDLLKNAKLVFTIRGTGGWEGILLKKPVITFGNVYYNVLPMVKKCRAIEDCPWLVKEQLENFNYDEKALISLIAAIYKESVDVDLVQLWDIEGGGKMDKKEKELIPLVDLIAQKLDLKPIADSA